MKKHYLLLNTITIALLAGSQINASSSYTWKRGQLGYVTSQGITNPAQQDAVKQLLASGMPIEAAVDKVIKDTRVAATTPPSTGGSTVTPSQAGAPAVPPPAPHPVPHPAAVSEAQIAGAAQQIINDWKSASPQNVPDMHADVQATLSAVNSRQETSMLGRLGVSTKSKTKKRTRRA